MHQKEELLLWHWNCRRISEIQGSMPGEQGRVTTRWLCCSSELFSSQKGLHNFSGSNSSKELVKCKLQFTLGRDFL